MATTVYATMLTRPASVETIRRYLYSETEVVEAAPVVQYNEDGSTTTGDLVFLILRTETLHGTLSRQQYQIDRLASGMHGATGGFESLGIARDHARARAEDNGWGLGGFAPFVISSVEAFLAGSQ